METTTAQKSIKSIYEIQVKNIDGKNFDMNQLKGKKVMIVNTASKCGFTPQYEKLQELWERYKDKNFIILAFPANNFMNQEPGSNQTIKEFCSLNYGVTFPVMSKISVKGKQMHPLYKWLTTKELNGKDNYHIKWNFQKFLISPSGEIDLVLQPKTSPLDKIVIEWIEQ